MSFCHISCILAIVFLTASLYLTLSIDKNALTKNYLESLNEKQRETYNKIMKERRNIYLKGFTFGLMLSIFIISINILNKKKLNKYLIGCITASTTLITTYLFYILAPKTDNMILHLETKEQKEEWLKIYKTYQYNYHMGFVIGIIGAFIMGQIYC